MEVEVCDKQNLMDSNMLRQVLNEEAIAKQVLERFLEFPVHGIRYIPQEDLIAVGLDGNCVCLHVENLAGKVYDVELCIFDEEKELKKRLGSYQSSIDVYNIKKYHGMMDLNDSYIIFICRFPLFNENRHKYTFKNVCIEDHDIALNDGATKLFLSTKGIQNDVSKPLQAFLDYIDGQEATDELLRDIDDAVHEVKHCEAWKEEYSMLSMDHYKYWKEGMAEGIVEGLAQGKAEVVIQMLRKQLSLEMIAEITNFSVEEIRKIAKEHALM